jgi:hypothetical protein
MADPYCSGLLNDWPRLHERLLFGDFRRHSLATFPGGHSTSRVQDAVGSWGWCSKTGGQDQ